MTGVAWKGVEERTGTEAEVLLETAEICVSAAVRVLRLLLEEGRKWYFEDGQRRWSLGSISSSF